MSTNVGLAAGRYSGTSRPDLNLTPHALHSVFGPSGPVRHCGVFSDAQCVHRRTPLSSTPIPLSAPLLRLRTLCGKSEEELEEVEEDEDCATGMTTACGDDQLAAAAGALDRLLRAPRLGLDDESAPICALDTDMWFVGIDANG